MKTKKSNTTGMATDEQYISKIPWIPHMDFLKILMVMPEKTQKI
ncbi:unnamed protein product [Acanthoscelides obtectus]|uniref:Uncharacterized protein n=1 Tax=Acanthoscelides obtectus TaxID=200917 RepID=A0A9P0QCT0_ACAOB|nr:unnamed protein product [Acanthoscelides obtectus]CAK1639290.1 hypothetical protein AOBTE_LOCUS11103 [Acanthoscelides obtectus]